MNRLEKALGKWVIRYRWLIIITTLLLTVLAASGGRFLTFTTNYRIFFSSENPQLLAFEALEKKYAKNDNVMFVITPKDKDVFTPRTLKMTSELTREAWQIPFSTRVDSITNFQHTEAQGDDLLVHDLVRDPEKLSRTDLEKIRRTALNEPILRDRLISPDSRVTAINVTINLPGKDQATENPRVVEAARALANRFEARYPDIRIRLTGMIFMNNAFTEAVQADGKSLMPLSFGLMILFLWFMLKNVSGTLSTAVIIIFSILIAMGCAGWLGMPLSPPSGSAPTIILTMAIASSVHLLVSYQAEINAGLDKREAVIESLRINLQPIFLASLTTTLGFLSMTFSEVPPFQHLGIIVAMGVIASFILVVTFLPAVISLLPVRRRKHEQTPKSDPLVQHLSNFVVSHYRKLLWITATVTVALISFIPSNQLNDVFLHYFDKKITFRLDSDYTTQNLTGMYIIDYSVESGKSGGISDPQYLNDLNNFAEWYRKQPETIHVNTFSDIMKRLNRNMHGDDPSWYRLPGQRDLAAQYLLLYEMSLPYGLDLNNQVNVDKSSTRMVVSTKTLSTNDLLALETRAQEWLKKNAPHITSADGSGTTMMFAHIGKRNIVSMLSGTTLALIMISGILIFAFRSMKMGMISMIPNLIPAAMGFGLWGIMVGEVGLALSVVTGMTLGIVVDDTVHFMSKYLRARREKNMRAAPAVDYAFRTVGRALFITSIVLIAGFLVLALSSFKLNSGMGLLTAIIIGFALLADFLLLPSLLIKFEEKTHENKDITPDRRPASA